MLRTLKLFSKSSSLMCCRFCTAANIKPAESAKDQTQTPTETAAGQKGGELKEKEEIPIHLRSYDKTKYEVPSSKIKYCTGYALLDVEPMPRARIMKLCYILLDKLKNVPPEALYRIYTEEKLKYIMKITDETSDIRELEEQFGHESIEIFIQALHRELYLYEQMIVAKPWEARIDDPSTRDEMELFKYAKKTRDELKHLRYDRPPREQTKFIETK